MEKEVNKLEIFSGIVSQIPEKNQKNLYDTAKQLLKVQKDDAALLGDALFQNEPEKQGLEYGGNNEPSNR